MSGFKGFLWLDFRQDTSTPGLFQSVPVQYIQHHRVPPCDTLCLAQAIEPQYLCFEFDIPQPPALAALLQTRAQLPDLPVVLVTETHSESLALWAFRAGVLDYLIKPLTAEELNTRLKWLVYACLKRSNGNEHLPAFAALQPCVPWHAPQSPSTRHKTLAARKFVATHFAELIRLAHVADLCHMCTSEFSRAFKKENGRTFSEYLLWYRISKACELLSGLSVQVKTVAFNVGFNDLSYFARVFRRYTGTTPSQYQGIATGKNLYACNVTRS